MSSFLKETIKGEQFELLIDTNIFPKDIILKAAYNHLDKGYFFFKSDTDQNMILEFTKKVDIDLDPKMVIGEYSDELLDVYLRDKLEKENRIIREAIVTKSLSGPLDETNFVSYDSDNPPKTTNNGIDFDKDIDDILKDIENDIDLQIDDDEINEILNEIEEESKGNNQKPEIIIDPKSVLDLKSKFKK